MSIVVGEFGELRRAGFFVIEKAAYGRLHYAEGH
jgi:hypothetical protein